VVFFFFFFFVHPGVDGHRESRPIGCFLASEGLASFELFVWTVVYGRPYFLRSFGRVGQGRLVMDRCVFFLAFCPGVQILDYVV